MASTWVALRVPRGDGSNPSGVTNYCPTRIADLAGSCYDWCMPKTKTLTTSQATSQAAARVRNLMAGEVITVNSRGSWDMDTDTHLVITTISYPPMHPAALDARAALRRMAGVRDVVVGNGYITVTREK